MADDTHPASQPPPPPEGKLKSILKHALIYAGSTAAVMAIASKLPFLRRFVRGTPLEEAIDGAAIGTGLGVAIGMTQSDASQARYGVELENHALKEKMHELQTEKSFAMQVAQEKMQEPAADTPGHKR